jgi:hypothetical protein
MLHAVPNGVVSRKVHVAVVRYTAAHVVSCTSLATCRMLRDLRRTLCAAWLPLSPAGQLPIALDTVWEP